MVDLHISLTSLMVLDLLKKKKLFSQVKDKLDGFLISKVSSTLIVKEIRL